MSGVPDPAALPRLASPQLLADIATVIVATFLAELEADAGFVATLRPDGQTLDVARVTPYSDKPVHLAFPVDAPYPLAETIRTRQPLFIASNDELCEHPGLIRVKSEDHACATLPLLDEDGELLGALNLGYDEPHAFTSDELELIDVLGRHCAQAMSVARHLQTEVARRTPYHPDGDD